VEFVACKKHAVENMLPKDRFKHTTPEPRHVLHVLGTVPGGTPLPSAANKLKAQDIQQTTNGEGCQWNK
jgi:hypothetical protein